MAKRAKRFWNFKRSASKDRTFLDWFGKKPEPSTLEGMADVGGLLADIVNEAGFQEGVTLDELQSAWEEIVGKNIANNSEPIEINKGILKVRVSQPVIRFELQQRQNQLIKKIQEKLPQAKVKRINVMV